MQALSAIAVSQSPAIRHNTAPPYLGLLALAAQLARLKTDDEIPGGMVMGTAVSTLDGLIGTARKLLNAKPLEIDGAEYWRASTYAVDTGEQGACVKQGDDTICDLPYGGGHRPDEADYLARRIAACVNVCHGLDLPTIERTSSLHRGPGENEGADRPALEAAQDLLRSALVALQDLDAGYPWRELHIDLDTLRAKAAAIGVVVDVD